MVICGAVNKPGLFVWGWWVSINIFLHGEIGGNCGFGGGGYTFLVEDTKSQKSNGVTLGTAHKNNIFSSTLLT